jgi:hypothetical protein
MRRAHRIRTAITGAILAGLFCLLAMSGAAAQDSTTQSAVAHKSAKHKATKKSGKSSKSSAKNSASTKATSTGKHSRGKSRSRRKRGQQAIDSGRAREIQEALIRQHYMDGEPSGQWDAATEAALRRFQADQGWQTKTIPDSRALIKLGLGPSKDGLLNPESAMTTAPAAPSSQKPDLPSKTANESKPQP